MPGKLRAVEPGEGKPRVLTVAEAAAKGDHREMLVALRARMLGRLRRPRLIPWRWLRCLGK